VELRCIHGGIQRETAYNKGMKYLPGLMVGELSGSAGNTTASRNRNGAFLRTRVMPVNPNTALQSAVRANLQGNAQNWKALTDAQRAGWTALGLLIVRSDSLGRTYTLTGLQAYISINQTLFQLGVAQVSSAPAYTSPANLLTVAVTATSV